MNRLIQIERLCLLILLLGTLIFNNDLMPSNILLQNEGPKTYLIILQYFGSKENEPIDIAEEYYLITSECISNREIEIENIKYGIFPVSIAHPNGVELCCIDTLCHNGLYSKALAGYSYLDVEEQIIKTRSRKFNFGARSKAQIFVVEGEYCICGSNFSQISYKDFARYAYFTQDLKKIRSLNHQEKKRIKIKEFFIKLKESIKT